MSIAKPKPLFETGRIHATPGALADIQKANVCPMFLINRHITGDGGSLSEHDRQANADALREGGRIWSAYILPRTGVKVWIITEADRSSTTLLLPSEY